MTDSVSLVGRTNVGKSLLFNKLIQYKNSIVLNKHGVTRDTNEGKILYQDQYLNIIDTAGISTSDEHFSKLSYEKTIEAIKRTSTILFVTSIEDGITSADKEICSLLRKMNKPIILVVNKCDKQKSNLKNMNSLNLVSRKFLKCLQKQIKG